MSPFPGRSDASRLHENDLSTGLFVCLFVCSDLLEVCTDFSTEVKLVPAVSVCLNLLEAADRAFSLALKNSYGHR